MNIVEKHWVEMPDGVKLFTIVQRPAEGGRFPAIFMRSPYHAPVVDEEALRKEDLNCLVIVVSADVQEKAQERVLAMGAIAFIRKPITAEGLRDVLKQYGVVV